MNKSLFFVVITIGFILAQDATWKDCGTSKDLLQIKSISLSPDPPQVGNSLSINGLGSLSKTITSGTLHLRLKYYTIQIANSTYDLCSTLGDVGIKCPLNAGPLQFTATEPIPTGVPIGPYYIYLELKDSSGNQITCLDINATLVRPSGDPFNVPIAKKFSIIN